jgi:hypothetical protein
MTTKDYPKYSRWVSPDCRVWEKREWGWKFLGIAKSQHAIDVLSLISTDCDHPEDIF